MTSNNYGPQKKHAVRAFWAADVADAVTTGCGHKHPRFEQAEACRLRLGLGVVTIRCITSGGEIYANAPVTP